MPTAKGWTAADIKRLTGRAAPGPWLTLTVVVPVATKGTLNSREHWAARARRVNGPGDDQAAACLERAAAAIRRGPEPTEGV